MEEKLKKRVWDPIEKELSLEEIRKADKKLEEELDEMKKKPEELKKKKNKLMFWAFLGTVGGIFLAFFVHERLLIVSFLSWIPYYSYVHKIQSKVRDMAKYLIAQKKGWVYDPRESGERWKKLEKKYPSLFKKGDKGQKIGDEFWGEFKIKERKVDMWVGVFEYKVETRDSKGRTQTTTYHKNMLALHLPKDLGVNFRLEPESLLHGFLDWFRKKEINTESVDFNKAFAFYYEGKREESELGIVKVLSPAVQDKLLDCRKRRGDFSLEFKEDTAIFGFDGLFLKKLKTDFFTEVKIAKEDLDAIEGYFEEMGEIVMGIVKYLD